MVRSILVSSRYDLQTRQLHSDHQRAVADKLSRHQDKTSRQGKMELRPIQAAILAGRSASRRATTAPSPLSYPSILSYRCFSSTRPSLSEAEATAPTPPPSMQEWNQQQQQKQQQSGQPQPRTWGNPSSTSSMNATSGSMTSLLRPNQSTTLPSTSTPTRTPNPSDDSHRLPWTSPSSLGLRRAQANRAASETSKLGIFNVLEDMDLVAPNAQDLIQHPSLAQESAADIKYRLRPSIGRTVHLDGRVDLARGLGLLNTKVRVNKIAQDVAKQRFHERPGMKRKRLRSERWRARFKDGFKATCSRVQELARQGW